MRRRVTRVAAVTAMVVAGCTASTPSTAPPAPVPAARELYDPPDPLPDGAPGDVVWGTGLAAPEGVAAWTVLYRSTTIDDTPTAVSGWVAVSPVPGRHGVLVFAHGTTGLGDACAPTRSGGVTPHHFADLLDAGWTVAFTDYEGLGTPGVHPYLVADSAARSVLDAARAAARLDPNADVGRTALLGFSQGGHAVLSAAERAADLAPELTLAGVVTTAPAILLREWVAEAPPGQLGYLGMIAVAHAQAHGQPLDDWLSPEAAGAAEAIGDGCLADASAVMESLGPGAIVADTSPTGSAGRLLDASEPATTRIDAPVLLVTGTADTLFTPDLGDLLVDRMCRSGTDVAHLVLDGASHVQLGSLVREPAAVWLEAPGDDGACGRTWRPS
jgi:pimeloyl-ACP methyl ester carboxylesterase